MIFPELNLILAIFRSPEFGFLGFTIPTRKQTPFMEGRSMSCGEMGFRLYSFLLKRAPRRTCWNVADLEEVVEKDLWVVIVVDDGDGWRGEVLVDIDLE